MKKGGDKRKLKFLKTNKINKKGGEKMKKVKIDDVIKQTKIELHEILERILLSVEKVGGYSETLEEKAMEFKKELQFLQKYKNDIEFYEIEEKDVITKGADNWMRFCEKAHIDEVYLFSQFCKPNNSYFYVDKELGVEWWDYIHFADNNNKYLLKWNYNLYLRPKEREIKRKRIFATIDKQGKLVYTEIKENTAVEEENLCLPSGEIKEVIK